MLYIFCLMIQIHCWNYFAFNQSYTAEGQIALVVVLPHEAKYIHIRDERTMKFFSPSLVLIR